MLRYSYLAKNYSLYLQVQKNTGKLVNCFLGKGRTIKKCTRKKASKLN